MVIFVIKSVWFLVEFSDITNIVWAAFILLHKISLYKLALYFNLIPDGRSPKQQTANRRLWQHFLERNSFGNIPWALATTELTAVNENDMDYRRKQYFFWAEFIESVKNNHFFTFHYLKPFCKKENLAHSHFIFVRLKNYHRQNNLYL